LLIALTVLAGVVFATFTFFQILYAIAELTEQCTPHGLPAELVKEYCWDAETVIIPFVTVFGAIAGCFIYAGITEKSPNPLRPILRALKQRV